MKLKEIILLGFILLIAGLLRLLWLERVPPAITGDELTYVLTVKSVALTGHDLKGTWSMPSALLFQYPEKFPQAELSYFLLYPIVGFTDLSLFTTKITYAILSILTVFVIYLLTKELFDKKVAIIAVLVAACNPWLIYIGRTAYEMVPSAFFYLLAIWFILKLRGPAILATIPIFLLAFYSYIATKVSFLPIVFASSAYSYILNKKKFAKEYIFICIFSILVVLLFFFSLSASGNSGRGGELFTPFSQDIVREVNEFRKNSMSPHVVSTLFENKLTDFVRIAVSKIINAFSFDYLFLNGDQFISIHKHGLFYYLDLILLIIGSAFLYFQKRKEFLFLGALIFASVLPQVFYKTRIDIFTPHLALFVPLLIIPIAYGASKIVEIKQKIIPLLFVILYVVSVLNFSHIYFFEFPLIGHFDFASRILSKYVSIVQGGEQMNIYVKIPEDSFKKYLYYTNSLNKNTAQDIKKAFAAGDYSLGKVHFLSCSEIPKSPEPNITSIYQSGICEALETNAPYIKISDMIDNGQLYRIYNDTNCGKYALKPYASNLKISDFSLEQLSEEKFCQTFITR